MTYCVAININSGFVVCSDSRTNAGFDNVSTYQKMHTFVWPNNRVFALLSAGNLATTQLVIKRINADLENRAMPNLLSLNNMQEAADYIASVNMSVQNLHVVRDTGNTSFEASFILAGQIGTADHETLMIYPQGNYIHESDEHPFLQIGEAKYGKPILDRVVKRNMLLERAGRCALVSMNSTVRSNLTVGPPIDLLVYEKDSLNFTHQLHLSVDNVFAKEIAETWNEGLVKALQGLPKFYWETPVDNNNAIPVTNSNQSRS
ncbi:MAG: peptidase [Zetaproteobacteria bacterium CG12_big_fil_rev_8_21_14_0_65_54_13]|nr:MAG: peptidase [Zetaproteobacteria bacterium CG12_big_fil_rev_8_21_14_0_65_54_13]PIX54344.1 MAG: peptidase [Zetaproteobacteria bacterium CG_4_10_14_3_um_filter_54_28]PJA28548.1 MAG: peptidase [Zetaproteobacteria bacterium CG_4_9_14_3_um_filter_54_145]